MGCVCTRRVLGYGVKVTGATVHFVNDEHRRRARLCCKRPSTFWTDDTPETLQQRVMQQVEHMLAAPGGRACSARTA